MKKKIIAAMLIVSMLGVSLTACGSKELSNDYVTITQYKGLEVDKVVSEEVTDEAVEADIESTLASHGKTEDVTDRAVENGDTVIIDYTGSIDGVEFEGGAAEEASLDIGSGSFIEGFEEAIVGHNIGEEFDINVTFPEEYQNAEVAGKDAVFAIKLHSIQKTVIPELSDELVAEISEESKTVEEYKKEVKETLQESNDKTAKQTLEDEVWNALLEKVEVKEYPKEDLEKSVASYRSQYEQMAEYYGVEWEEFLTSYMNVDEEGFTEQLEESARTSLKGSMALELIAEKEKLIPSEKEFQEKYETYATDYGYESVDAMIEAVSEETLEQIVTQEVVLNWLVDNCKQVEPTESTETEEKE
ncbi:trigger factor [Lachnospiraceae bacterium OttesenSCG-928-E19]|nr:trigger factor [Lachnospiraceae bacterium OttesenSCG-928-E19]